MKNIQNDLMKIEGKMGADQILHNRKIDIASSNLIELNKRWDNHLAVVYVTEKEKFEPSDYTDEANYRIVDLLNKFINWDLAKGVERAYQIQNFMRSVQIKFEELNTEFHYRKITNDLNDEDYEAIEVFIRNYRNFSPTGFLNDLELKNLKSTLNQYCEELETNFLSTKEEILELDFHTEISSQKNVRTNIVSNHNLPDSSISLNQFFSKYFRRKNNEDSIWMRLIGG